MCSTNDANLLSGLVACDIKRGGSFASAAFNGLESWIIELFFASGVDVRQIEAVVRLLSMSVDKSRVFLKLDNETACFCSHLCRRSRAAFRCATRT